MSDTEHRPVQVINTFNVKPGKMDEFVSVQQNARQQLFGDIPGLRGSRLHRSLDGATAVLIAVFDSPEDNVRFQATPEFAEHRKRLAPLIEKASPSVYETAYEYGDI
jgi:heme-degrading monooxygenase HmoA